MYCYLFKYSPGIDIIYLGIVVVVQSTIGQQQHYNLQKCPCER